VDHRDRDRATTGRLWLGTGTGTAAPPPRCDRPIGQHRSNRSNRLLGSLTTSLVSDPVALSPSASPLRIAFCRICAPNEGGPPKVFSRQPRAFVCWKGPSNRAIPAPPRPAPANRIALARSLARSLSLSLPLTRTHTHNLPQSHARLLQPSRISAHIPLLSICSVLLRQIYFDQKFGKSAIR
jgi:hypothetical protein